jgi:hypothetical protein
VRRSSLSFSIRRKGTDCLPPSFSCRGLITGRTALYLWDPKNSGLQAKKGVVTTQSHEVVRLLSLPFLTILSHTDFLLICVGSPMGLSSTFLLLPSP